jgi:fibrillarin-like rRNA methylase
LKAFVANELLQDEKGNLEEKVKMWDSKYSKIAAELQAILERLSNLETEKKVGVLYVRSSSEMVTDTSKR